MKLPNRDMIVLLRDEQMSQQAINAAVDTLDTILRIVESDNRFCNVHELVNRNSITNKKTKILKAVRYTELKPFVFLLNKN